eukprot:2761841-Prymnesium_polylepis.1
MSANPRGQPPSLEALVDVTARVSRQRGQSEPSPALPERRKASSNGAKVMYGRSDHRVGVGATWDGFLRPYGFRLSRPACIHLHTLAYTCPALTYNLHTRGRAASPSPPSMGRAPARSLPSACA